MHSSMGTIVAASVASRNLSSRRGGFGGGSGNSDQGSDEAHSILKKIVRTLKNKESIEIYAGNIVGYDLIFLNEVLPKMGYTPETHRSRKNNLMLTVKKTPFFVEIQKQKITNRIVISISILIAFAIGFGMGSWT